MFRAIGTVIVLYAISQMLNGAFHSFERALIETFAAIEMAAIQTQNNLRN